MPKIACISHFKLPKTFSCQAESPFVQRAEWKLACKDECSNMLIFKTALRRKSVPPLDLKKQTNKQNQGNTDPICAHP